MKRCSLGGLGFCVAMTLPVHAAGPIDQSYVRSLAARGKVVLVVEYYDAKENLTERRGFASRNGYKAVSATDFAVTGNIAIHLFGIEPCDGDLVNRREQFAGTCADYAREGLETLLKSVRVVFCRAFLSEADAPTQDASCYGYFRYPGSLDSVEMFEQELVAIGAHRIAKKPDGGSWRPDLQRAEKIARGAEYGMWADARVKAQ